MPDNPYTALLQKVIFHRKDAKFATDLRVLLCVFAVNSTFLQWSHILFRQFGALRMTGICQRYILAGGPGAGKTTVLDGLAKRGFLCVSDHARAIIRSRLNQGLSPRPDPLAFTEAIFEMDVDAYARTRQHEGPVFFERGLLEPLGSLCRQHGKVTMDQVEQFKVHYPYNTTVFFFGPWAEIYVTDAERDHSFAHAVAVAESTTNWYRELGFTLLKVPKLPPEERVTFILDHIEVGEG